jgi:hypothetical protein
MASSSGAPDQEFGRVGRGGWRGRMGKKQAKVNKLRETVQALAAGKAKAYSAAFEQVKWGKFDKEQPWLPCVVVPPELMQDSLSQLELARAALASKRGAYVVYWLGYGILSKLNASYIKDFQFEKEGYDNPNEPGSLLTRNISFIESAAADAVKMKHQSRETLAALVKASREIGNSSLADSDDDQHSAKTSRKRGRFHSADVDAALDAEATQELLRAVEGDYLEPSWPAPEGLCAEAPLSLVISTNMSASFVNNGTQNSASNDVDDDHEEDEDEDDDYDDEVYTDDEKDKRRKSSSANKKRKAPAAAGAGTTKKAKKETKPKKKQVPEKPKKTLKEKLSICKRKLERLRDKTEDKSACAEIADLLQKMGKVRITKDILEDTEIGMTVGALRKHPNEMVAVHAKTLRDTWKAQILGSNA